MFDYVLYGTFLRTSTLPVSKFQSLAAYIPSNAYSSNDHIPLDELLKYVDVIKTQKDKSAFSLKQYYSMNWIKEITYHLSNNEVLALENVLKTYLKTIQAYHKQSWKIPILSSRIFNMLIASHYIFANNNALSFSKEYYKVILQQAIYLRRKLKKYRNDREYILYIIRALYMSIAFLEERNHLKQLTQILKSLIEQSFYPDGGHIGRNTSFQLKILEELIKLRDLAKSAGIALPNNVQTVINTSVDYLNFMRHPDGKLAIFNGSYESEADYIDMIMNVCTSQKKNNKFVKLKDAGFYRLNAPNMTLITDLQSFEARHQYDYQSMLSFELSIGRTRVFSNCGSGDEMGGEWIQVLQKSAAHNMPILDIPNIRPSLKKPIITGKKNIKPFVAANSQGTTLESAQSYEFGKTGHITHHRHLTLFKTGKILRGEDTFSLVENDKKSPITNPDCYIRFHLGTDIKAKSSSTSVILSIPEQGDWMFTIGSGKIILEPSIYLGTVTPQNTKQIVVKLTLSKPQVKFRWTLQALSKNKQKPSLQENETQNQEETPQELEKIDETI